MAANCSTLSLQLAAMQRVCMICNDFFGICKHYLSMDPLKK